MAVTDRAAWMSERLLVRLRKGTSMITVHLRYEIDPDKLTRYRLD